MYDTLLFLHFFGVSIGAGTGIYMMALARHAARNLEQAEARTLMPGIAGAVSGVGTLGLVVLLASGIAMALMLGDAILTPVFLAKLALVAVLTVFVVIMKTLGRRVSTDPAAAQWIGKLALLGPVLGVLTIFAAVMAFH